MNKVNISILVPVLNELENLKILTNIIKKTLTKNKLSYEIIFIDDGSSDGSQTCIIDLAKKFQNIKYLFRTGPKSLSQSVIDGFYTSVGSYIIVMDADLQHNPEYIPALIQSCKNNNGLSIASRYIENGVGFKKPSVRYFISKFSTLLACFVLKTKVSDPMTGFFAVERHLFTEISKQLSGVGYKILLEIIYYSNQKEIGEIPYVFDQRQNGISKSNFRIFYYYLCQLISIYFKIKSVEFISFCIVGFIGLLCHIFLLNLLIALGLNFLDSHAFLVFIISSQNYILNQYLTFSDTRQKLSFSFNNWLLYLIANGVNLIANTAAAVTLFNASGMLTLSSLFGVIIGIIWNYTAAKYILKR